MLFDNRLIIWFKSKNFLKDVSLVYFGSMVNGVSLFLINLILARVLEKDWFAIFSLAILALSTAAEMSDFGLNGGLLRFAPAYLASGEENKLKQLVKTIWRWRLWLSIVLTVGGIILAYPISQYIFKQPALTNYFAFSFLGIGGVILLGFVSAYLQANQKFFQNSLIQVVKGLSRLILVLILIWLGVRNLYVFLGIYILIPWILFFFARGYLPKEFTKVVIEAEVKKSLNKQLAHFSFWLTIWSLSAIVSSRVDQVMLSYLLGLKDVALYAVAFQFVYLYSLAAQAISSVLLPKINQLQSKEEIVLFVKKVFHWLIPIIVLGLIVVYPSQYVIEWLFGQKYVAAMPIYLVLSWSMLFSLISIPLSLVITVYNKTQLVAFSGFLQLIINVGLNFLLIPKFGALGAAITFSLGIIFSLVYNIICSIYLFKKKKIVIV